MKTYLWIALLCAACLAVQRAHALAATKDQGKPETLTEEQGELLGQLGFGALTIDAYYEICVAAGHRTDNHLNGINKLAEQRWGVSYSEVAKQTETETGRNFRDEAHKMIHTMVAKFGGRDTPAMKKWLEAFQTIHETNLKKFHALGTHTPALVTVLQQDKEQAEKGDAKAQYRLAQMYASGNQVEKDNTEALKWYRKAAEQGFADAQAKLGDLYRLGQSGVERHYIESAKWYLKAAQKSHVGAQIELGEAYLAGQGVLKDVAEAYAWFNLAATKSEEAAKRRDALEVKFPDKTQNGQWRTTVLREQIEAKQPVSPPPSANRMVSPRAGNYGNTFDAFPIWSPGAELGIVPPKDAENDILKKAIAGAFVVAILLLGRHFFWGRK